MTRSRYLHFKDEKCPHCAGKINITVFYDVVDRFQVDYNVELEKGIDHDMNDDEMVKRLAID